MATPSIDVNFDDPNGVFDGHRDEIRTSAERAWEFWAQHLEADTTFQIGIEKGESDSEIGLQAHAAARQTTWYPRTGEQLPDGRQIAQGNVVDELIVNWDPITSSDDASITIYDDLDLVAFPADNATETDVAEADFLNIFTHEFGHILGITHFDYAQGFPSIYKTHVETTDTSPFGNEMVFTGPEVQEHYGGPVDLSVSVFTGADPSHFDSNNDIMAPSLSNENAHVSRADLAVLADLGLPVREASLTGAIVGTDGVDTQRGTLKHDVLAASAGNDTLIGEDGVDTAVYPGSRADYEVLNGAVNGPAGEDLLDSVERVQFADETVSFGAANPGSGVNLAFDDVPAQVSAIYLGYYNRAGEPAGMDFWSGQIQDTLLQGETRETALERVASSFRSADEGIATYPFLEPGSADQATASEIATFVDSIYQNLFNRAPEGTAQDPQTGLGFWVDTIDSRIAAGEPFGDVILRIIQGAQNEDVTTLENKIEVASSFATELSTADYENLSNGAQKASDLVASVTDAQSTIDQAQSEIQQIAGAASGSNAVDPGLA